MPVLFLLNSDSLHLAVGRIRSSFPPTTISLLLEMHLRQKFSNSSRFVLKQSEVDENAPNGFYNKDNAFKIQMFFLIICYILKQICKKTLHALKLLLF